MKFICDTCKSNHPSHNRCVHMTDQKKERLKLDKVTIKRTNVGWLITREREDNGESFVASDLESAFNYIRCIYDNNGEYTGK